MTERPRPNATQTFVDAAEAFRIDVDDSDKDKMSAGIVMSTGLDAAVDEHHQFDSGKIYRKFLQGDDAVLPLKPGEAEFVREVQAGLCGESQCRWQNAAEQLGSRAIESMQAKTIGEYIASIRKSSPLLADVMRVENGLDRDDYDQRQNYNRWLYPLMRYTYMLDTFRDVDEDYRAGRLAVAPTERTVKKLGNALVFDKFRLAISTPRSVRGPLMDSIAKREADKSAVDN